MSSLVRLPSPSGRRHRPRPRPCRGWRGLRRLPEGRTRRTLHLTLLPSRGQPASELLGLVEQDRLEQRLLGREVPAHGSCSYCRPLDDLGQCGSHQVPVKIWPYEPADHRNDVAPRDPGLGGASATMGRHRRSQYLVRLSSQVGVPQLAQDIRWEWSECRVTANHASVHSRT